MNNVICVCVCEACAHRVHKTHFEYSQHKHTVCTVRRTWNYTHISYFNRVLTLCQYLQSIHTYFVCHSNVHFSYSSYPFYFMIQNKQISGKKHEERKKKIRNSNCSDSYIIVRCTMNKLVAHHHFLFMFVFNALLLILVICTHRTRCAPCSQHTGQWPDRCQCRCRCRCRWVVVYVFAILHSFQVKSTQWMNSVQFALMNHKTEMKWNKTKRINWSKNMEWHEIPKSAISSRCSQFPAQSIFRS